MALSLETVFKVFWFEIAFDWCLQYKNNMSISDHV